MSIIKIILLTFITIIISGCKEEVFVSYKSYPIGLEKAQEENKPIFIHFTCFGCVGYNEFENDLINNQVVQNRLNKDYISIELYVDDKAKITEKELTWIKQQIYPDSIKQKLLTAKNIGQFYSIFEFFKFRKNSQPLYVILSSKEEILVQPFGYIKKDALLFLKKLEEGTLLMNSK